MAKPIPSPEQIDLINALIAQKQGEITAATNYIASLDVDIANKTSIDEAFKDLWNWYNDSIINPYVDERRAINGLFLVDPLTNDDIEDVIFDPTNARLFPDPGNFDIKRISQFDGTPTDTDSEYELSYLQDQSIIEDYLVNGFGGTIPGGTLTNIVTTTAITPASTQVTLDDTTDGDLALAIGDRFILDDTISQVAIEVTGFVENPGGSDMWDVDFIFLVSGSVGIGSTIDIDFVGFDNTDRTNKTSIDYQPILDGLISNLETVLNNRITKLDEQITARGNNDDPDGSFGLTDLNTSKAFIQNYLLTTDISDIGLTSLSTERISRTSDANTRVATINAAFTGQTENYYDRRYEIGNDRAQIRRGMLTEIRNLELTKESFLQQNTNKTEAIASLNGILP